MLVSRPWAAMSWTYDNWGANPGTSIGTQITGSASTNTKGSWVQIASSANIANDVYAIYLQALAGSAAGTARNHLADIGVDPAGGTSYSPIIENIGIGSPPTLTVAGNREMCFPWYIPAGSSVAMRTQCSIGSASFRAAVRFYGQPSASFPRGSISETIGEDTSTSLGTSFTPGNASDGSWVDLGATTYPLWWWQLGYGINNTTVTAEYTYIELAWGDASNKHTIFRVMHGGTTNETCGLAAQTSLLAWAAYQPVPAGANIYVRGRCNNAPDTGYHAVAVGIGGSHAIFGDHRDRSNWSYRTFVDH